MSEQLTLSLRIKTSDLDKQIRELEKRLMPKGFGNGHANGMGEQQLTQSKKLNAFTEKIQGSSMKQGKVNDVMVKRMGSMTSSLLKLGGISLGIGAMIGLMTKSSGILQSTFKLFGHSMLLFFKPIADIMGIFLRPMAIRMVEMSIAWLRIAEPWYESVKGAGQDFANFFTDPKSALADLGINVKNLKDMKFPEILLGPFSLDRDIVFGDMQESVNKFNKGTEELVIGLINLFSALPSSEVFFSPVTTFFTDLKDKISTTVQPAWNAFTSFMTKLYNVLVGTTIINAISEGFQAFSNLMDQVRRDISSTVQTAWFFFKSFFKNIYDVLSATVLPAWNYFVDTFVRIKDSILDVLNDPVGAIKNTFATIASTVNDLLAEPIASIKKTFGDIASTVDNIFSKVQGLVNKIPFIGGGIPFNPSGGGIGIPGIQRLSVAGGGSGGPGIQYLGGGFGGGGGISGFKGGYHGGGVRLRNPVTNEELDADYRRRGEAHEKMLSAGETKEETWMRKIQARIAMWNKLIRNISPRSSPKNRERLIDLYTGKRTKVEEELAGGYPLTSMAAGGIINEPIFGQGLNTGTNYMMGEKGPEMVTPLKKAGNTINISVNISGNNISSNMDLDQLGNQLNAKIMNQLTAIGVI